MVRQASPNKGVSYLEDNLFTTCLTTCLTTCFSAFIFCQAEKEAKSAKAALAFDLYKSTAAALVFWFVSVMNHESSNFLKNLEHQISLRMVVHFGKVFQFLSVCCMQTATFRNVKSDKAKARAEQAKIYAEAREPASDHAYTLNVLKVFAVFPDHLYQRPEL